MWMHPRIKAESQYFDLIDIVFFQIKYVLEYKAKTMAKSTYRLHCLKETFPTLSYMYMNSTVVLND